MKQSLTQDERDALASPIAQSPHSINGKDLVIALAIFIALFCIFVPKVYLSKQIYTLSRDIAKSSSHLELLQEENQNLKKEMEEYRFKQSLMTEV